MSHNVIFLTGATGFVGQAVVDELLSRGRQIKALDRRGKLQRPNVTSIRGDLFDSAALANGMAGADCVIHLVGIIRENKSEGVTFDRIHVEGTRAVIAAARTAGVKRLIHLSALGVDENSQSKYAATKATGERLVRDSGLDWTIIRPSLIHGPGGEFTKMMLGWIDRKNLPYLFMPFFGRGLLGQRASLVQPVYVKDVARAIADAADDSVTNEIAPDADSRSTSEAERNNDSDRENGPATVGRTIEIAGADGMTWPQMYRTTARVLRNGSPAVIGIPVWYAKAITHLLPPSLLPFNRSQVIMAAEDNVTTPTNDFKKTYGWSPGGYEETLQQYV